MSKIARISGVVVVSVALCAIAIAAVTANQRRDASDQTSDRVVDRLIALGYMDYVAVESDPEKEGVLVHDEARVWPGVNLYHPVNTSEAFMTDMRGRVLHTWRLEDGSMWKYWKLFADGHVVGIVDGGTKKLVKMDWSSRVVWARPGSYHHDVAVSERGDIHALRAVRREITIFDQPATIVDDLLVILDASGSPRSSISIHELLWDSVPASRLRLYAELAARGEAVDVFHSNTVVVLDRDLPIGRKGDVLVCVRNLDRLVVVDVEARRVVWSWGDGELDHPHKPEILANGNILVFDNGFHRTHSRVVEYDPTADAIVWEYTGTPPESFFSQRRGSAQQLANGNLLIAESDKGRVFEISRGGEIVWDYWGPHYDEDGRRIPINRMIRLSPQRLATMMKPGMREALQAAGLLRETTAFLR